MLWRLFSEIGTPPVFVAVEYDRVKFHEMKGQRDRFRQELCEWRAVPPDVLAPLVASLAYEPDAVDDVFPAIPCVWLEEGATAGTDTLSKRWLNAYQVTADTRPVNFTSASSTILLELSKGAWDCFDRRFVLGPTP